MAGNNKQVLSRDVEGVELHLPSGDEKQLAEYRRVLTPEALDFVVNLHRTFEARRQELLHNRRQRQEQYAAGELPDFLAETAAIREGDWRVGSIPKELQNRCVEITGPADRKMIINALNSGAMAFMADFEDALSPTWDNLIEGQGAFMDLWRGCIDFTDPASGKSYSLAPNPAVLMVRPRGWHLDEGHILVDGSPVSGSLFDFGLYFFHNAQKIHQQGSAPYFYLPKIEHYQEAALWNDVLVHAQHALNIPQGSCKVTVLIETLPAAFQMDEILQALREHIAGLNCGRWDYIFSYIKTLGRNKDYILPDRAQVVMGEAFLRSYSLLLIKTCHKRGAFAMGGMAAQIPVKGDAKANDEAFAKVRKDKEREVRDGHDGTWVAHPALVPVALEAFSEVSKNNNQLNNLRDDVHINQEDLLRLHQGSCTLEGLRECIGVGVQYMAAWLSGRGAVPLYNLMEDAATAEISRTQIWQWLQHNVTLTSGEKVDKSLFNNMLKEEMKQLHDTLGAKVWQDNHFEDAAALFADLVTREDLVPFLTLPAYQKLLQDGA